MAITLSWHSCYSEGWQNEIVPEAFSHPAKFSRGLIRRIYAHALEQGYLKPGDWVVDCFAGVGLGAADALALGLNWFGNELEQNFVDLGGGCDCTGISKADWVTCFGRWKRFAHKDGRHWCPRCLAEAEGVIEPRPPTLPGMGPEPTASYERNSGKIPHTEPHRYAGNLDLFVRHARNGATAVLVQGDSRRLVEVLEGAKVEGLISSPPYANAINPHGEGPGMAGNEAHRKRIEAGSSTERAAQSRLVGYGTDPAQLGNMPTGEPPSAVISSPPWESNLSRDGRGTDLKIHKQLEEKYNRRYTGRSFPPDTYGGTEGQLGAMPTGEPPSAIVSSPPYANSLSDETSRIDESKYKNAKSRKGQHRQVKLSQRYSPSPANLGNLPTGEPPEPPAGIIASPPFIDAGTHQKSNEPDQRELKLSKSRRTGKGGRIGVSQTTGYGDSDGQLAALPEGEPPAGIVSSPPYEGSMTAGGHLVWRGQGTVGAHKDSKGKDEIYGQGDDNLGNQQGDTFWAASRLILLQCHAILAPGGVAIWVLKAFVRNKAIVDFPGQWEALCNSCGFETIEVIKAWLVEDRGAQFAFNGDLVERKVARKSFFRRLHESKYPDLAIDWEVVLITRKVGIS